MATVEDLDAEYYRISKSWRSLSRQDKDIAIIKLIRLEDQADAVGKAGQSAGADIRALKGLIQIAIAESPR